MPPEPLPWDRKDFFKERKHERSAESVGSLSRWRETPHHGLSLSSREFARWGSPEFRSRPPGHVKQGGWHLYSEESGHGFTPSQCNDKIVDDGSCQPSGSRADGKYNRNSRENRVSFSPKDFKGHSWESGASPHPHPHGPGRPVDVSDQMSVDDTLTSNPHPHSDFANMWDQVPLKDHNDKIGGVNGLDTGQRFEGENLLGSDWKPRKWARSGSLSSRGPGFSHSSSPKSLGPDSSEAKAEEQLRNVTPLQSPSGDAVACATSTAPSEETSRKKPRLGWGEGLAKYEKKKVEGPDDSAIKHGTGSNGSIEPLHTHDSIFADKSPRVAVFSDCASPATPSSVGCSSSPGAEEKPFLKAANMDNNTSNSSDSPNLLSQNHLEGRIFSLENLDLTSISNLSSSICELLESDDPSSVDSSYVRFTSMNKLLVWKGSILKALEMTESGIDSLENELKSLMSETGNSCPCPAPSTSLQGECQEKPFEELVSSSNLIPRPAPLQLVLSGDMIVEKAVGGLEEEHAQVRDEDFDSPGTVTSNFVEPLSSAKVAALSGPVKHGENFDDLDSSKARNLEIKCSVYGNSVAGDQQMASKSCAASRVDRGSHCDQDDILYDLILASNKDSANRASEVFNNVLPSDQCHIDVSRTSNVSSWTSDPLIKEKFAMRQRFLRFKERVITLKFRAFQHLWKEDLRLLSIRKYHAKPQKRFELILRTPHGCYQKHRSSIRSRVASPGGNLGIAPTTEIINFTSKLLSDSQIKHYRSSLKMPALILDKKEKITSRFVSNNGLVEDPCAVEKERAIINPWTSEEREIFMDKLTAFGKDFRKISSFLDHKTTADCIEFYYKNHKSDCFIKTKKKPEIARQGKSCATDNYLITAGKRWNRQMNAASLDMLGVASAIAANADDAMEIQQKRTVRSIMRRNGENRAPLDDHERSGSLDFLGNDREAVAADVLARICGSLSSEAMSSCITSSFDLRESYRELKYEKVGSLNVDDETCSDDSCGEMGPSDWTDEEKSVFIQAVSSYGKDFAMISRCVRTKSRDQCKIFFSKARKCLGLDRIGPRPDDDGKPLSDDANGGGSESGDACVVETGSVICSEKSGEGTEAKNVTVEGKMELDCELDSKMENDVDSMSVTVEAHGNAGLSPDTEVEGGETTGKGTSLAEPLSGQDAILIPEVEPIADDQDSADRLRTEPKAHHLASVNNLNEKQDRSGDDANTSCPSAINCSDQDLNTNVDADTNATLEFGISPNREPRIDLELDPPEKSVVITVELDVSHVNTNSMTNDPPAGQYVKTIDQDTPSTLDLGKISDKQCQKPANVDKYNQHQSDDSVLGCANTRQILMGYPLPISTHKEENGDISFKKLASPQRPSRVDTDFHSDMLLSQECFLQKCNSSKSQSSVPEIPFLSQEQKRYHTRHHSWGSSDTEKPGRKGDFKLFGRQILTQPSQQKQIANGIHENEGVRNPEIVSNSFNQKFNITNSIDVNPVPSKLDQNNNHPGLENVPIRSYGFWDGNRIQTGFSALPDSAILLAKYPAAFGNYSTSSPNLEQQQPRNSLVRSTERNLNGVSVFSTREPCSSNGLYPNREGTTRVPPLHNVLFSEMQRRSGFEPVSNIPQQPRGMVGINVVGRGGILVGGSCTGVADPVAAIKMHYAKNEQFNGQTSSIIRDESWRGKGDIGR